MTWRLSVKVGDLVKLKHYCKESGRFALLVETHLNAAKIMFVDTGVTVNALKSNLERIEP